MRLPGLVDALSVLLLPGFIGRHDEFHVADA